MKTNLKVTMKKLDQKACQSSKLQQAIDLRTTEQNTNAMVCALDLVTRFKLGQFGHMLMCLEQLSIKLNKKTIQRIRLALYELIDVLCDNSDLSYKNRRLHDAINKIDNLTNGYSLAQPISIEEPIYKALELSEYLHCKSKHSSCERALECWVTRRGFGMCPNNQEMLQSKNDTIDDYISECCNAIVTTTDLAPDFIGDDPKTMTVGTVSLICSKCKQFCNIKVKNGKTRTKRK